MTPADQIGIITGAGGNRQQNLLASRRNTSSRPVGLFRAMLQRKRDQPRRVSHRHHWRSRGRV
ncbi:hypothetical protein KCP69_01450 [Salmonella enterica subsp. enterica]|nr:hypothetical protein KCP69_01450 [Salmonella enterica subsp. enterica]